MFLIQAVILNILNFLPGIKTDQKKNTHLKNKTNIKTYKSHKTCVVFFFSFIPFCKLNYILPSNKADKEINAGVHIKCLFEINFSLKIKSHDKHHTFLKKYIQLINTQCLQLLFTFILLYQSQNIFS